MDDGDKPRLRAEEEDMELSCLLWVLQLPGTWKYSAVQKLNSAVLDFSEDLITKAWLLIDQTWLGQSLVPTTVAFVSLACEAGYF